MYKADENEKLNVAILGSGNIGMNLLYKIMRSKWLNCLCISGRNKNSINLKKAQLLGIRTSSRSIESILEMKDQIQIVFDATNAEAHRKHSEILKKENIYVIDLTPSKIGKICLPCLNAYDCLRVKEVNMVTCGGQSMVPVANAISSIGKKIKYMEVISTIPSISAGKGTRENIDDYIYTTQEALREFTDCSKTKAMLVLNPAEPAINMHNTLYIVFDEKIELYDITEAVKFIERKMKKYVPGFCIISLPEFIADKTIVVSVEVKGTGDFLPEYAGNLDIITCAGIEMAEQYAINIQRGMKEYA